MSVATLPARPAPHWFWVSALSLGNEGSVYLVDGDRGRVLGMISTGYFSDTLAFAPDHRRLYAVETYFSRGTRGERTDVVTVYDGARLRPSGEVVIPPRRAIGFPMPNKNALTDDGSFLLVYNYSPGQSVSVVDLREERFAGEVETSGCALVFPSGARRFHMLCGDGSLLTVELDERGAARALRRSPPFFDPRADPVTEKAVRAGSDWLFVSTGGAVYSVDVAGDDPEFGERWSLIGERDRAAGWGIGGSQHLAVHRASGTLYAVVGQRRDASYKDPGSEVWVYDLATRRRVQRIRTQSPVQSLQVSQDAEPLLFTASLAVPAVDVYDARTGAHVRTIQPILLSPHLLQVPWRGERS